MGGALFLIPPVDLASRGKGRNGFSMPFKFPSEEWCSSSRPMSSKCVMSDKMPSAPDKEDEWKEEDFEDLDPVRPGGEPGASGAKEVISSYSIITLPISERWLKCFESLADPAGIWLMVLGVKSGGSVSCFECLLMSTCLS